MKIADQRELDQLCPDQPQRAALEHLIEKVMYLSDEADTGVIETTLNWLAPPHRRLIRFL